MHLAFYFLVFGLFLFPRQLSFSNLTRAIGYMFTYKSHILEIDARSKMKKHLKMKRISKILSCLLDHGIQMISAFAKCASKIYIP